MELRKACQELDREQPGPVTILDLRQWGSLPHNDRTGALLPLHRRNEQHTSVGLAPGTSTLGFFGEVLEALTLLGKH